MPETTKTTVAQAGSTGQYQLTIPGGMGAALDLKDAEVYFNVLSENALEMKILDSSETVDRQTVKVNKDSKGSYRVTLPKALGDGMKLAGEKVKWKIKAGNKLKLSKTNGDE